MEYKFSERVLTLKPSAIREIFKYAADPTYISLSAGNPAPEAFPVVEAAPVEVLSPVWDVLVVVPEPPQATKLSAMAAASTSASAFFIVCFSFFDA